VTIWCNKAKAVRRMTQVSEDLAYGPIGGCYFLLNSNHTPMQSQGAGMSTGVAESAARVLDTDERAWALGLD
jgi:hypothetical protein